MQTLSPTQSPNVDADVVDTMRTGSGPTDAIGITRRPLDSTHDDPLDPQQNAPVIPQSGDRIGPYLLQDSLGAGVSCFVFRGWDEEHGCPVAVKIVNWSNVYDRTAAM